MRKKDETLRETLLALAGRIVCEQGAEALNIRALAGRAGVASGTVYNYFTGKDDILLALTEAYWRQTLAEMGGVIRAADFPGQLREIYAFLRGRMDGADGLSGGLLMRSLGSVEAAGRQRMQAMQLKLRTALVERLRADAGLRPGAWGSALSEESFADFTLMSLVGLLRAGAPDIEPFLEIVKRTIY